MAINWEKRTYTKEELIEAWNSSISIRECAKKLNVNANGGSPKNIKNAAEELGLTKDHMLGQAHNKGKRYYRPINTLEEVLIKDISLNSNNLKKRLIREGLLKAECSSCHLSEWLGNPMPIELDHINGDNRDNRIENLRILCPTCHSLTATYRGKNINGGVRANKPEEHICECGNKKKPKSKKCIKCHRSKNKNKIKADTCACGNKRHKQAKQCIDCYNLEKSSAIPSKADLETLMNSVNWVFTKAGKHYCVSDNAVRKWCRKRKLSKPEESYSNFTKCVKHEIMS